MGGGSGLVHILDGIALLHHGDEAEPGRLEVSAGALRFLGERTELDLRNVRDVAVEGDHVVLTTDPDARFSLVDRRPRSTRRRDAPQRFAGELRDMLGLPEAEPDVVPVRALTWGIVGTGVAGGFLAAVALAGGGFSIIDFLEAVYQGGFLMVGSVAFALLMGRRAAVPAAAPWSLVAASAGAGILLGVSGAPELAEAGPDDLHQLFGTPIAIGGEILMAFALVIAVALSLRSYPRRGASVFGRAERAEHRRSLIVAGILVGVAVTGGILARVIGGPAGPARSDGDEVAAPRSGTIQASLRDFAISLAPASSPRGRVAFNLGNQGPSAHQFWVYRTDLPPNGLPVDPALGRVNESGEGFSAIAFVIQDIAPGTALRFEAELDAGRYVAICNIPGHYQRGMFASFTVA